jgi:hypothetical protein
MAGPGINGWENWGIGDYRNHQAPTLRICTSCKFFHDDIKDSSGPYACQSGTTDCAACDMAFGKTASKCNAYVQGSAASGKSPSEGAILDRKPMPKLPKLLIIGLIVSVVWAVAILVYGKIKTNLVIDTPVILTLVSGIPLGTVAFTLFRLLKNVINKGATAAGQKVGGNLFGWIVSTLLPYVSPVIIYVVMASFVFHAKLF